MDWKTDENIRATAILRVSSRRQKDNTSHDIQEREVKEYCQHHELKLVKTYRIIESAKNSDERRQYNQALSDALTNGVRHILFYMFDRESRNLTDNEKNENLVKNDKIVIHYVRDSKVIYKGSPDSDFFMRDIQAATNKQFIRNLSAKVQDAMRTKAELGWFPSNHVPLGYIHQKLRDENGKELKRGTTIVIDPDKNNVRQVQREFDLRSQGLSYQAIKEQILKEGFMPRCGAKNYSRTTIEKRLKNKFYSGKFDWQGIEYQGKHPLIIDRDTLRMVQGSFSTRGWNPKYKKGPFSDFLSCATEECGRRVIYDPKKKKIKSTGEVKVFHYYRCSNSRGVHETMRGMNVSEDKLWEQFEAPVNEVSITRDFGEQVMVELEKIHHKAKEARRAEMKEFKIGLQELEDQEDRLYDDLTNGVLDSDGYRRQIDRVRLKRRDYTELLEQAQEEIDDEFLKVSRDLVELCIGAKSQWNSENVEDRIKLLKRICSNQVLDGVRVRYSVRKSLAILGRMSKREDWRPLRDSNSCLLRERELS